MCITVKKKGFVPHSVTDATYPAKKYKLSAQTDERVQLSLGCLLLQCFCHLVPSG